MSTKGMVYSVLAQGGVGQLAGGRFDLCIVFPYKTSNAVKYGQHSDPGLREPTVRERRQMEQWDKTRESVLKQLVNCGIEAKPFYSRDKDEIFCKLGTDLNKLQEVAEIAKHRVQMKDEYLGAYAHFIRDTAGGLGSEGKRVSHLYKTREGDEGFPTADSVFRTVDRIQLVDHIVRSKDSGCAGIDIGPLLKSGDILAYYPLHESRYIEQLESNWWSTFLVAKDVKQVRDYFGERVGFYFAWTAHFSKWLVLLAVLSLPFLGTNLLLDTPDSSFAPLYCVLVALWSILFTHYWRRKEAAYALEWGSEALEVELEPCRPEFYGSFRINPITEKQDLHYPWTNRIVSVMFSYTIILVTLIAMLFVMSVVFVCRHLYHDRVSGGRFIFMLFLAAMVDALNWMFSLLAKALNDRENYRTQTDYENALLAKTVIFKFVNSYAALYYIAFFKNHSTTLGFQMECAKGDCLVDLSWQLTVFFVYRFVVSNFAEVLWPKVMFHIRNWTEKGSYRPSRLGVMQDMSQAEVQSKKDSYNPFDDFDEMVVQFGYCSLFVVAVPWIPLLALVSNIVEVWIDKSKLLHNTRRPMPMKAKNIGTWNLCFTIMGFIAVFTNAALVVFTTDMFLGASLLMKIMWFLAIEHTVIITYLIVGYLTPEVPDYVRILTLKHRHIVHKYIDGVEEENQGLRAHALQGRELKLAVLDMDDDDE